MKLNIGSLAETLPIMGLGMAGIFAVTIVIILAMVILNRLFKN